ncbi:hypothetical protein Q2K21_21240 [Streptomyces sp. CGMCC 4.7035]|nr:hypothetical protein [Streptomyces sp. CGMCC 4.7035]WNC00379.1 hypothetical protein Q2K21_21240 [Streptomyces sp. CGMCC 4.7035]
MNLHSHLAQRTLRLPPPLTRNVTVERGLRVPMRDGVVLLADRWAPKTATSQSTLSLTTGSVTGAWAPMSEPSYFANGVGYRGVSRPISLMCVA